MPTDLPGEVIDLHDEWRTKLHSYIDEDNGVGVCEATQMLAGTCSIAMAYHSDSWDVSKTRETINLFDEAIKYLNFQIENKTINDVASYRRYVKDVILRKGFLEGLIVE